MTALGCSTLASPISTSPRMVTWPIRRVRAPIRMAPSRRQNGPTSTPGASSTLEPTMALGWMRGGGGASCSVINLERTCLKRTCPNTTCQSQNASTAKLWEPRPKSIEELLFAVVGMLAVFDFGAGHTIALARPGAEVNHSASLGAERPEAVGRRYIDPAFADRTPH